VNISTGYRNIKVHRFIIFLVVLCRCEVWSVTLKKEYKLRVFKSRVTSKSFVPKGNEVAREWRKLHNEELNDQYCSPNIVRMKKSRRMRWTGHVARMGEGRGVYRVLVGKPEGKRPFGRHTRRDGRIILRRIFRKWVVGV